MDEKGSNCPCCNFFSLNATLEIRHLTSSEIFFNLKLDSPKMISFLIIIKFCNQKKFP